MDYYLKSSEEVLDSFHSSVDEGLSKSEVLRRGRKYGFNELDTESKVNPLKILLAQFQSFIIYILLFAVVFSILVGDYVDAIIIAIILVANAMIGFFQELSAQKSLEALKKLNTVNARVLRDGKYIKVDSKYLVPGDVIYMESGDKVPADCRIVQCNRLKVQEASLTGESVPVNKNLDAINKKVQIGDQKNMLFSSTVVVEGSVKAVVCEIGMSTEIGKITSLIKNVEEEETPLQKKLNDFGKKIGYIVLIICFLIFLVSGTQAYFAGEITTAVIISLLLIAIALAVAAVPEGLPAIVTIVLSVGVKRLLKKKALVRKLASVETLGSCNVICTDKTGTLTRNEMTVRKAWTFKGEADITGEGYNVIGDISKDIGEMIFTVGAVCNNADLVKKNNLWSVNGDPTEGALIVSAKKRGVNFDYKRLDEIPFDSNRKMMSVVAERGGKKYLMTKGAPDHLIKKCKYYLDGKSLKKLDKKALEKIEEYNNKYSTSALRVLAFAYREIKNIKDSKEDDLIFVGLQAMIDPPRHDVIDSIKKTKNAGIRVIMITGDHKDTAKAIAQEIGIEGDAITGEELSKMDDKELLNVLSSNVNVFARVIPEHKQRIVDVLQGQGNVVAMTGDGVNDAPALKKANIGVAVGSGTDVAKEAADFVLLDDSFSSIVHAIEEGRGIYDNIQKAILHLLSGNVSEVLIIFLAVLFNFNLPLTAILILWINLVTDGAPALALSVDSHDCNIMKRKPISMDQGILPKSWWVFICYMASFATAIALGLFYFTGGSSTVASEIVNAQTVLFTFVVLSETLLLLMIRNLYNMRMFSNAWIWITIAISFILQYIITYTHFNDVFGIVPLDSYHLNLIGFGGMVFMIAFFVYKYFIMKKDLVVSYS